jgi:hypothetical protein
MMHSGLDFHNKLYGVASFIWPKLTESKLFEALTAVIEAEFGANMACCQQDPRVRLKGIIENGLMELGSPSRP